jgi:hypothetical protein
MPAAAPARPRRRRVVRRVSTPLKTALRLRPLDRRVLKALDPVQVRRGEASAVALAGGRHHWFSPTPSPAERVDARLVLSGAAHLGLAARAGLDPDPLLDLWTLTAAGVAALEAGEFEGAAPAPFPGAEPLWPLGRDHGDRRLEAAFLADRPLPAPVGSGIDRCGALDAALPSPPLLAPA